MKAIFITFQTDLTNRIRGSRRRRLIHMLEERGVELESWSLKKGVDELILRLSTESETRPIIALDDEHGMPNEATWLAGLTTDAPKSQPLRLPRIAYVTSRYCAKGSAQAQAHPLIRSYIKRDGKTEWLKRARDSVLEWIEQSNVGEQEPTPHPTQVPLDIIGDSPRFVEAVDQLGYILDSPFCLVTGDQGVGKMFLIRAVWELLHGKTRITVLPCGSFFKDIYIGGVRRRVGGGRESIDQLQPFLYEAQNKLLVLHHVEQLPTAVQEDLVVRLPSLSNNPKDQHLVAGIDIKGLSEYDLSIAATSNFSPESLALSGRVIPELLSKLTKRHVRIPSLTERGVGDIQPLCEDIVRRISIHRGLTTIPIISDSVIETLTESFLPGNISDLVRVLEHAIRRSNGGPIRASDFPREITDRENQPGFTTLKEAIRSAKRIAIENALLQSGGNVKRASEILECNKGTLHRLMKQLGIAHRIIP